VAEQKLRWKICSNLLQLKKNTCFHKNALDRVSDACSRLATNQECISLMDMTVTLNIKRNMIDTSNRLNIKINVQKNNGLCERPDVLNVSSNNLIKHITRIKVYLQYWKQLVVRKTYQFNNNSIYIFIKEYVGVRVMVFNATFNNISAISWRLVILVD
jgi:hypothetical protein